MLTYPSGRIVNYVRDGRGRVTSVTTKFNSTAAVVTLASSIAYEPYGVLKSLNYGNTLKLENDWGSDARLVSRAVRRVSDNGVVWGASYGYDNEDNVAQVTDLADVSRVVSYQYDAASRLTRATGTYGTTRQYDYAFDANGNRTRVETRTTAGSASPTTATDYTLVAGKNRLASLSGSETRTISYDGRGNTSGETRPSVTATLTYDAHGRLTGYARTGDPTQAHVYNGLEDRVQVTRTAGTADVRRYLFDGTGRLIGDYGTNATDVKGEFVWLLPEAANDNDSSGLQGDMDDGAGGWMPLAVMAGSGASTVIRYLHGDLLGVPVATTNTTGAITTPGTYAELQFPGQIKTLADIYYNRWRDYDPGTGRYVQADPIGLAGGENSYLYAEANPLGSTDPEGLTVRIVTRDPVAARRLMRDYYKLNRSKHAREMNKKLEDSCIDYQIRPVDRDAFYCPPGAGGKCAGYPYTIFVDPYHRLLLPTTKGMLPTPSPVVLGHELGHAAGTKDSGPGKMDNVNANENPIRNDLGYPARTAYPVPKVIWVPR